MKPQKLALTQDYIDALALEPGQSDDVSIYDTERKGLSVRLRRGAGGVSKMWYVGKIKLGSTDAFTLMDARDEARAVLRNIADGVDPKAKKKAVVAKKPRPTFIEAALAYIKRRDEALSDGAIRRNTHRGSVRYLTGSYFQPLHKIEFAKIEKVQIVECINVVREKSRSAASQARGALIMLYDWAQLQGWIADGLNPARYTENPLPRYSREEDESGRQLSDDELIAVWKAAADVDDDGRITRLIILLGNRREEIGGMKWAELQDGIWTLPAARNKIKRARCIPLSDMARALIGERPAGRTYVFGKRDKGFSQWSHGKRKLDQRLAGKVTEPWGRHDLRRTMRSGLSRFAKQGVDRELAELMIGHIPERIVRIYDKEYRLAEQADAFMLWSNYVEGIIGGTVTRPRFATA